LDEGGSRVEWVDDIFGYNKMVWAEKATLQNGIHYRVGPELDCRANSAAAALPHD
jgi:hypothetical protein